jgi:hypothetical protein
MSSACTIFTATLLCGAVVISLVHASPTKDGNAKLHRFRHHISIPPVIALLLLSPLLLHIYLYAFVKYSQHLLEIFKLLHPGFSRHVISRSARRDDPPDPARIPAPLGEGSRTNKSRGVGVAFPCVDYIVYLSLLLEAACKGNRVFLCCF